MERSLGTGGHTEGLPEACSVSAVPETLAVRGPKRPPTSNAPKTRCQAEEYQFMVKQDIFRSS